MVQPGSRRHADPVAAIGLGMPLFQRDGNDVQGGLDPANPARGPGQLVGNGEPITDGVFRGGEDLVPAPAPVTPPTGGAIICDADCRSYCASLDLQNPVNQGACSSMWGVGIASQPIDRTEACRRLYVDMVGRYPTPGELNSTCDLPTWGETVATFAQPVR